MVAEGQVQILDVRSPAEYVQLGHIPQALLLPVDLIAAGPATVHRDERPLLVLTLKDGETLEKQQMLDFLSGKIVKWWTPDDVLIIDEMPMTATGKIRKLELREKYWNHLVG